MRLRRLPRSLPVRELPALLAAVSIASVVEVGLRVVSLPRLAALAGSPLAQDGAVADGARSPDLPVWALRRLSATRRIVRHWPFGDTCLRLALVSGWLLRSLHPVLRVGVRQQNGGVSAHAWLEIAGRSLDVSAPGTFAVLRPMAEQA